MDGPYYRAAMITKQKWLPSGKGRTKARERGGKRRRGKNESLKTCQQPSQRNS